MGLTDRLIRVERHLLEFEAPQAIASFFDRYNRTGGQGILAFSEHLFEVEV
jgi:hypothetical protein